MARVNGRSPNGTVASRERRELRRRYEIEKELKEKRESKSGNGSLWNGEISRPLTLAEFSFTTDYLLSRVGKVFPELAETCDNLARERFIDSIIAQLPAGSSDLLDKLEGIKENER